MPEEQELRAWSLAIVTLLHKEKSADFEKLTKSAAVIGEYIKTGTAPPEKDTKALYQW